MRDINERLFSHVAWHLINLNIIFSCVNIQRERSCFICRYTHICDEYKDQISVQSSILHFQQRCNFCTMWVWPIPYGCGCCCHYQCHTIHSNRKNCCFAISLSFSPFFFLSHQFTPFMTIILFTLLFYYIIRSSNYMSIHFFRSSQLFYFFVARLFFSSFSRCARYFISFGNVKCMQIVLIEEHNDITLSLYAIIFCFLFFCNLPFKQYFNIKHDSGILSMYKWI